MYSIVLMMAMTSGGDLPALGHHHGCCGGYSSCSGSYSSCSGSYSSCSGSYSSCSGSYSSCSGYSACSGSSSCCGGRHKLFGGRKHHNSCCGGYTSCNGGYEGGYIGCNGGYNGGYVGCTGGVYGDGHTVIIEEGHDAHDKKPEEIKKPTDKKPEDKKPEVLVPSPATIIVSLPADANLTIDDAATTSTSAVRVFMSPTLPLGQEFHYTLKAEYVRDGKPVVLSQDITVRAGEETRVNLEAGLAGVASR